MRTGIFGGSFDPPHKGHVKIALAAKEELGLERIFIVPTGQAPHKPDISADTADRVNMCRQLCEKYGLNLSLYEAEKEGNCYTADLIEYFSTLCPEDELYLIVGGDSLDYMDKWYHPERIFPKCRVVVARRSGTSDEKADFLHKKFGAKIIFLNCGYFEVSSTEVRKAVLGGKDVPEFLEPETADYIKKNNLYR